MNLKPDSLNRYPGFKYFQKLNKCYHKIQFPEEITPKELTLKEHENIGNLKLDPKWIEINTFTYSVTNDIMKGNEDHENISIDECWHRNDWSKVKDVIQSK